MMIKNDNDNDNKYEKIKNVKDLNKLFIIGRATGDGNCLFYSLSTATFGSDGYFNEIRNAVCDYMENNDIDDLHDLNKEDYIKDMRKNGTYVWTTEVQVYSIISKLKIICFVRTLQKKNKYKSKNTDPIYCFISGKEYNTEIYIMITVKEKKKKGEENMEEDEDDEEDEEVEDNENNEMSNHYVTLKSIYINNKLNIEKKMKLKKVL